MFTIVRCLLAESVADLVPLDHFLVATGYHTGSLSRIEPNEEITQIEESGPCRTGVIRKKHKIRQCTKCINRLRNILLS